MTNASRTLPRNLQGNSDIRIIGDRSAGKTTFLAALARYPNAKSDTPVQSVYPFDENAARLIAMAQDILENGLALAPTRKDEDVNQLAIYTFLIELKRKFFSSQNVRLQISLREYSGEIIKDLLTSLPTNSFRAYLDDCANASGMLLLIDGTSREDKLYAQALTRLQAELNERLIGRNKRLRNYRIAIVFSKAEQAQIWCNRHDIKQFVNLHFPQTQIILKTWSQTWRSPVNYFFCSAFGMKGYPPQPNVKVETRDSSGTYGIIANPAVWRPFGLIAPIYWLHTGKDEQNLRDIEE
jgi:Double-GTPase 1